MNGFIFIFKKIIYLLCNKLNRTKESILSRYAQDEIKGERQANKHLKQHRQGYLDLKSLSSIRHKVLNSFQSRHPFLFSYMSQHQPLFILIHFKLSSYCSLKAAIVVQEEWPSHYKTLPRFYFNFGFRETFLNGPNPASFCFFSSSSQHNDKYSTKSDNKSKKLGWRVQDLNLGPHYGGHTNPREISLFNFFVRTHSAKRFRIKLHQRSIPFNPSLPL